MPQGFDQLIHGARSIELRIAIYVLTVNANGFTIKEQRHIRIAANPVGSQLVWAAQQHLSGVSELNFLKLRGDDFNITIKCEFDGFLAAQIVGHILENGLCIAPLRQTAWSQRDKHHSKGKHADDQNTTSFDVCSGIPFHHINPSFSIKS